MTKDEFIREVATTLNEDSGPACRVSRELIRRVLDTAGEVMLDVLTDKSQGKVDLLGLGTLKTVSRKARDARNPRTGATVRVPAKSAAKFTPSKALKDAFKG
jgi:DNA-binding protein HU-beta